MTTDHAHVYTGDGALWRVEWGHKPGHPDHWRLRECPHQGYPHEPGESLPVGISWSVNLCLFFAGLQIGFEKHWLEVIRRYVVPVQQKVFPGYHSKVGGATGGAGGCRVTALCSAGPRHHELCGKVPPGWAVKPASPPRLLHLHH